MLQYGLAVAELAAAATRLGNAPLALSACRLACELSAAAPPWRLAQLWQLLPPGALLQLGGLLVAGLGRARKGNSTSSAATRGAYPLADIGDGAALWLQAVTASQPPPRPMRADDAGGLALARALAGALHGEGSGGTAAAAATPDDEDEQQRLAKAALGVAVRLSRSPPAVAVGGSGGAAEPLGEASARPGLAPAQACLLWLASLAAEGHSLAATAGGTGADGPVALFVHSARHARQPPERAALFAAYAQCETAPAAAAADRALRGIGAGSTVEASAWHERRPRAPVLRLACMTPQKQGPLQ